jgi:hypothetical protein
MYSIIIYIFLGIAPPKAETVENILNLLTTLETMVHNKNGAALIKPGLKVHFESFKDNVRELIAPANQDLFICLCEHPRRHPFYIWSFIVAHKSVFYECITQFLCQLDDHEVPRVLERNLGPTRRCDNKIVTLVYIGEITSKRAMRKALQVIPPLRAESMEEISSFWVKSALPILLLHGLIGKGNRTTLSICWNMIMELAASPPRQLPGSNKELQLLRFPLWFWVIFKAKRRILYHDGQFSEEKAVIAYACNTDRMRHQMWIYNLE